MENKRKIDLNSKKNAQPNLKKNEEGVGLTPNLDVALKEIKTQITSTPNIDTALKEIRLQTTIKPSIDKFLKRLKPSRTPTPCVDIVLKRIENQMNSTPNIDKVLKRAKSKRTLIPYVDTSSKKIEQTIPNNESTIKTIDSPAIFRKLTNQQQNNELINFTSQTTPVEKIVCDLPEEKVVIAKDELKRIISEIKIKYLNQNFTIKSLSEYVGANLSNAYSKGSSISFFALKKLKDLVNRKIPHILVLGNKGTSRIILNKSKELAELVGFILVSGKIQIYTSENNKKKAYSLYIHFRERNRYKKLTNHIKSLILNLFKIEKTKIKKIKNENNELIAFKIYSLPIFYEIFIHGIRPNYMGIPKWVFEENKYVIHCLKGFFNGYGDFKPTLQKYKKSVYGYFSLTFEKASSTSIEVGKDFIKLCEKLNIKTSKIYKRQSSKEDPTIRILININKKDSYIKFLTTVNPLIWNIQKENIHKYYSKVGINPDTIFNHSEDYQLRLKIKESSVQSFEENLLHLFEQLGNFNSVYEEYNRSFDKNKRNPLGKDRIIGTVRELFDHHEFLRAYGVDGYERWYKNNSRIFIGDDIKSIVIPFHLNIQIYRKIFQILNADLFDVEDSKIVEQVIGYFVNKKMIKISNVKEPNLLEYGRFSYLLKNPQPKELIELYFNYIIKFIREINFQTEKNKRISYVKLANRYKILFYHHQQVKQMIEDLQNMFSKRFKVGYDQKYKWHRLSFEWHSHNFENIRDGELFKKLSIHFNKLSIMDYDVDIFRIENPSCSDFYISGSRSKPIIAKIFLPYIKELHDKGIIKINSETSLGTRLIKYVNLAEQYYKKKYPLKSYSKFLSDENNIYHAQLQNFIFMKDSDIIGTEILVWLKINFPNIDYLSGHIDFLFFFNNCLYICDYKPEKRDRIFLKSIPQISAYGLILKEILKVHNLKIKCITFNKTDAWEYQPSILYTDIKHIIKKLRADYNISAEWEKYLNQYFDFS